MVDYEKDLQEKLVQSYQGRLDAVERELRDSLGDDEKIQHLESLKTIGNEILNTLGQDHELMQKVQGLIDDERLASDAQAEASWELRSALVRARNKEIYRLFKKAKGEENKLSTEDYERYQLLLRQNAIDLGLRPIGTENDGNPDEYWREDEGVKYKLVEEGKSRDGFVRECDFYLKALEGIEETAAGGGGEALEEEREAIKTKLLELTKKLNHLREVLANEEDEVIDPDSLVKLRREAAELSDELNELIDYDDALREAYEKQLWRLDQLTQQLKDRVSSSRKKHEKSDEVKSPPTGPEKGELTRVDSVEDRVPEKFRALQEQSDKLQERLVDPAFDPRGENQPKELLRAYDEADAEFELLGEKANRSSGNEAHVLRKLAKLLKNDYLSNANEVIRLARARIQELDMLESDDAFAKAFAEAKSSHAWGTLKNLIEEDKDRDWSADDLDEISSHRVILEEAYEELVEYLQTLPHANQLLDHLYSTDKIAFDRIIEAADEQVWWKGTADLRSFIQSTVDNLIGVVGRASVMDPDERAKLRKDLEQASNDFESLHRAVKGAGYLSSRWHQHSVIRSVVPSLENDIVYVQQHLLGVLSEDVDSIPVAEMSITELSDFIDNKGIDPFMWNEWKFQPVNRLKDIIERWKAEVFNPTTNFESPTDEARELERIEQKVRIQLTTLDNKGIYETGKASIDRSILYDELANRQVSRQELLLATTQHPVWGSAVRHMLRWVIETAAVASDSFTPYSSFFDQEMQYDERISYETLSGEGGRDALSGFLTEHFASQAEGLWGLSDEQFDMAKMFTQLLFTSFNMLDISYRELRKGTKTRAHHKKGGEDIDHGVMQDPFAMIQDMLRYGGAEKHWGVHMWVFFDIDPELIHNLGLRFGADGEHEHVLEMAEKLRQHKSVFYDVEYYLGSVEMPGFCEFVFPDEYSLVTLRECERLRFVNKIYTTKADNPSYTIDDHDNIPEKWKPNVVPMDLYQVSEMGWQQVVEMTLSDIPVDLSIKDVMDEFEEGKRGGLLNKFLSALGKLKMFPDNPLRNMGTYPDGERCSLAELLLLDFIWRIFAHFEGNSQDRAKLWDEIVGALKHSNELGGLASNMYGIDLKGVVNRVVDRMGSVVTRVEGDPSHPYAHKHYNVRPWEYRDEKFSDYMIWIRTWWREERSGWSREDLRDKDFPESEYPSLLQIRERWPETRADVAAWLTGRIGRFPTREEQEIAEMIQDRFVPPAAVRHGTLRKEKAA